MKTNHPFSSTRTCRNLLLTGLAICLLGGLTLEVFAPPPGAGNGKATAVKITFRDLSGDRIRSDGKGSYIHGVDRVTAVIHDSGQLELDTGHTSTRRSLALDYGDIVLGCGDPGTQVPDLNCNSLPDDPTFKVGWGRLSTLDLNLLTMANNETRLGGFGVRFTDGCSASHVPWTIRFRHEGTQDSVFLCGPTCGAQVSVTAYDDPNKGLPGTGVDTWVITADVLALGEARTCLWSGGSGEAVLREIARMPFQLLVELK